MELLIVLGVYILLWMIWWILVPFVKYVVLLCKYDIDTETFDAYKPLDFKFKYKGREVKVMTSYIMMRYYDTWKPRHSLYDYYDFVKYSVLVTIDKLSKDPNLQISRVGWEQYIKEEKRA